MKTLLFNGCSFVAGDEIVWDSYCIDSGVPGINWRDYAKADNQKGLDQEFWNNYRYKYRPLRNLPAIVAKSLRKRHIDISSDGNSNDLIAFGTVNYFLKINPEERKNYHACIGWTTLPRFMKYSTYANAYFNLHVQHIGKEKTNPIIDELKDYVYAALANGYDEDFFLNFVKNVLLLESFFIANDISYTFYKSLGNPIDTKPGRVSMPLAPEISIKNISDHECWMAFDGDMFPIAGNSWTSSILHKNQHLFISAENRHPNLEAATKLSGMIVNKIISQNVGLSWFN